MKVQLESTTKIVSLNGIQSRIWEGETESGIKVHAFITRIAVDREADSSEFDRELSECVPPSADVARAYPASMVI